MTKLTMPEPAAYVRFADNGNIHLWSKSAYEGEEFMKPLYTAEALRDVLEQAALEAEHWQTISSTPGHACGQYIAAVIRAMMGEIK